MADTTPAPVAVLGQERQCIQSRLESRKLAADIKSEIMEIVEAIYEPCGIYKKYSIIVANTNEQTARAAGTTPRFQATVLGWKTDCNGWEVLEMGPTCASSHLALDELLLEIGYDLWDSFILHVRKAT